MDKIKTAKFIFGALYAVGAAIVLCLCLVALFGSKEAVYPDSMMRYTWRNMAFFCLVAGTLPMLLVCFAVYKFNGIKTGARKNLKVFLVFLPAVICCACALFLIALIIIMLAQGYMHHIKWISSHPL